MLQLAAIVNDLVATETPITVIAYKGRMDTGRKLAIEVLEYFDSIRFTQRRGTKLGHQLRLTPKRTPATARRLLSDVAVR